MYHKFRQFLHCSLSVCYLRLHFQLCRIRVQVQVKVPLFIPVGRFVHTLACKVQSFPHADMHANARTHTLSGCLIKQATGFICYFSHIYMTTEVPEGVVLLIQ